jgi:lipase chaperone LimK
MRQLVVLCLATGVLALLIAGLPKGESRTSPPSRAEAGSAPAAVAETTAARSAASFARGLAPSEAAPPSAAPQPNAPPLAPLPPSLQGTEVDGELRMDAGGRLIVTPETRAFFDYFLSAAGEESPDRLKARMVDGIHARLPARAAAEAVSLLERYLLYRERARAVSTLDPEIRLRHLRDLRREVFGHSAAEALFGEEEKLDALALEARRLRNEAGLPPDARRARAEATFPLRLLESERALDGNGVTGEDRRQQREQRWGEAVADRLETLEGARAEWNRRLHDFREARAALLRDDTLGPEQRSSAIDGLLARDFTPQERLRVLALDRIEKED